MGVNPDSPTAEEDYVASVKRKAKLNSTIAEAQLAAAQASLAKNKAAAKGQTLKQQQAAAKAVYTRNFTHSVTSFSDDIHSVASDLMKNFDRL